MWMRAREIAPTQRTPWVGALSRAHPHTSPPPAFVPTAKAQHTPGTVSKRISSQRACVQSQVLLRWQPLERMPRRASPTHCTLTCMLALDLADFLGGRKLACTPVNDFALCLRAPPLQGTLYPRDTVHGQAPL